MAWIKHLLVIGYEKAQFYVQGISEAASAALLAFVAAVAPLNYKQTCVTNLITQG